MKLKEEFIKALLFLKPKIFPGGNLGKTILKGGIYATKESRDYRIFGCSLSVRWHLRTERLSILAYDELRRISCHSGS